MFESKRFNTLKATLFKLAGLGRAADYDLALHIQKCEQACRKTKTATLGVFLKAKCELHNSTASKLERMSMAVGAVPERDIWVAVGWNCVSPLVERVTTKRPMDRIKKDILKQVNAQGVVPNPSKVLWEAIAKHAPKAVEIRDAEQRERQKARPSPFGQAPQPAQGTKPQGSAIFPSALSKLAEEIRALIEGSYPFLREVLSKEALKACEVKISKKAKAG